MSDKFTDWADERFPSVDGEPFNSLGNLGAANRRIGAGLGVHWLLEEARKWAGMGSSQCTDYKGQESMHSAEELVRHLAALVEGEKAEQSNSEAGKK